MSLKAEGTTIPTRTQEAVSLINSLANAWTTIRSPEQPEPTGSTSLLSWKRSGSLSEAFGTVLMVAGGLALALVIINIVKR